MGINIPIWSQYVNFLVVVLNSLASFFHSGGLAIIAFTIIVKTLMLPLTVQSIRSAKSMQDLQPKLRDLQKKHGNDRQRLSQETMALYQQHRVNPMAGCLPMIVQIPIFLGLSNAIIHLPSTGGSYWSEPFLWIPSLAHPDPWHLLPILAGLFQFAQTQMMRPANQPKSTDPQQAMMNSVMNIMPLSVVLFGWSFAAGPVLYWATQSIYSVVQQWFITGWGSLLKWAPFLPELPEHRRLGYRPPRNLDDVVVVSGEGQPVYAPGPMGWMQRKMEDAQRQAMERSGGAPPAPAAEATVIETTARPSPKSGGSASGKNKKGNGAKPATETAASAGGNGAVIVQRKTKPAPKGD